MTELELVGLMMNINKPAFTNVYSDLISYLRQRLERPSLDYLEPPTLMGEGTGTWIFSFSLLDAPAEFDHPLILRLLVSRDEFMQIDLESIVQNSVADQGFPAPRVLLASKEVDELGYPFMIMLRVSTDYFMTASTLVARLSRAIRPLLEVSHIISEPLELQMEGLARLHSLDPAVLEKSLLEYGMNGSLLSADRRLEDVFSWIEKWHLCQYRSLANWLLSQRPVTMQTVICHGDPHPMNILICNGKLAGIIDWEEARLAAPELDIGVLCGHLRCLQLFPFSIGGWERIFQKLLINRYLTAYERHRHLDRKLVHYYEIEFLARVMIYIAIRQIRRGQGDTLARNPIMDSQRAASLIQFYLKTETGLQIACPIVV